MNFLHEIDNYLDFKFLRRVLAWMCVGVLALIPLDYVWILMRNAVKPVLAIAKSNPLQVTASVEPLNSYQSVFEQSALFGNLNAKSGGTVIKTSIAEIVKDYRLKGVVIGNDPEAIIEDARTQQSVFVRKGQLIGELQVMDIGEGYVVLGYLGEETRLQIQ